MMASSVVFTNNHAQKNGSPLSHRRYLTLKARIYNGMTKLMIRRLLALRLHFRIMGRVPSHDPKVQTQSKEPSNHELGAYGGDGGGRLLGVI